MHEDTDSETDTEPHELVVFWHDVIRYVQSHESLIFWWMEEGGVVLIVLIMLGLLVLDTPWYYYLPIFTAFATVLIMNLPQKHRILDVIRNAIYSFIFRIHRRRRSAGLEWFGLKLFKQRRNSSMVAVTKDDPHVSISNEHTLLPIYPQIRNAQPIQSRRSTNIMHDADHSPKKRHKKRNRKLSVDMAQAEEEEAMDSSPSEHDHDEKEDKEEEEEVQTTDRIQLDHDEAEDTDPNWETNMCFPGGNTEVWGSYAPCSAKTLKLRGATYLTDKVKVYSEESLLSLANMDIFTVHHRIHHMAQNEVSWFHQNRKKLPRSLFFFIIHLRLDSMTASVVQYFYIDRNKFKHLLESNEAIECMAKEKGDGYFAIGGNMCDELQESCEFDGCVVSGTNASVIDENVARLFTAAVDLACDIPNGTDLFDEARIIADTVIEEFEFPTEVPSTSPIVETDEPTAGPIETTVMMDDTVTVHADLTLTPESTASNLFVLFNTITCALVMIHL
eukprot:522347_1